MDSPFRVTCYDGALQRTGWLGDPTQMVVTPRHLAIGEAKITIPTSHPKLELLTAEGARVVCEYDPGGGWQHLISGPVRQITGTGPSSSGTVTVRVEDDLRLLWRVLGWPVPGSPLTGQTAREDRRTGPAETVAKQFIAANAVTRLGLPVTVVPTHGWGASITVAMRMSVLADRLIPAMDTAGIGLTVRQSGATLSVDAYVPATWPVTLTEASGVVQGWDWSRDAPTVTRTVVGGQGEGTVREFRHRPSSTATTPLEAQWGDKVEAFTDARDTDVAAELDARGDQTLAEGAPKAGLQLVLSDTPTFRYGSQVRVGDRVTVDIGQGVTITDVLREAVLDWGPAGLQVTPTVGERSGPDRVLVRALSGFSRAVRHLMTR